MQQRESGFSLVRTSWCALALAAALVGCDNNAGGTSTAAAPAKSAKLTGIVLDANGPIDSGMVEAVDAKGATVASSQLSGGNKYTISIPATAAYPIVLTAKPTDGSAPVKAVVTSSLAEKMDITSVSTLVVDNAMQLGGLTPANIQQASIGAIGQRQSRGVSAGAGGSTGGPGNSGGGIGQGGHGGHDMSKMGGGEGETGKMDNMSH
ncbi:hypothetical protein [Methylogaea oryzae]|uniref:hypothetical protein n=1 Tax=Methylogaea oryzae TaxID=1295382 RepID=UPI0006CF5453|nr:hypothetical protein [Methylogaea oryzae]